VNALEGIDVDINFPSINLDPAGHLARRVVYGEMPVTLSCQRAVGSPIICEDERVRWKATLNIGYERGGTPVFEDECEISAGASLVDILNPNILIMGVTCLHMLNPEFVDLVRSEREELDRTLLDVVYIQSAKIVVVVDKGLFADLEISHTDGHPHVLAETYHNMHLGEERDVGVVKEGPISDRLVVLASGVMAMELVHVRDITSDYGIRMFRRSQLQREKIQ